MSRVVTAPLDPQSHLLAELRRLDLILKERTADDGSAEADEARAALRAHLDTLQKAVRATLDEGGFLPLVELCRNLELDPLSLGVLMITIAPHVDRSYARTYASLMGEASPAAPRAQLALEIFGEDLEHRLALHACLDPSAPLARSGFFRLTDPPEGAAISDLDRVLTASPRLLRFLLDRPGAEPEVEAVRARAPLPPPTRSLIEALDRFGALLSSEEPPPDRDDIPSRGPLGVLRSEDPEAALAAVEQLAARLGAPSLLIDLARPYATKYPVERSVEAAFDEARLLDAILAIAGFDALDERARAAALGAARGRLSSFDGAVLLITADASVLLDEARWRSVIALEAPLPDAEERAALWARRLEHRPDRESALPEVSARYALGSAEILRAARMAEALDRASGPSSDHLAEASRAQSRGGLGDLAQRVAPWGTWDDLVLPDEARRRLLGIPARVRQRETVFRDWGLGAKVPAWRGLAALFAGPPGTGKTMSASLVAQALGLDLYRIDLASVVSKYIGETEKNLERVFRAARRTHAVLFFDEADALFGKRTEVKDAHDRHANVETSYLLQRIEGFEGLVILATNLKKNIDQAFLRRIEVLVDFPEPDEESRRRLWASMLPASMPREEGLDLGFLSSRFDLSGAQIKNAVQTGAFAAAAEGAKVGMRHLARGVQEELVKQGKIVRAEDFLPPASLAGRRGR